MVAIGFLLIGSCNHLQELDHFLLTAVDIDSFARKTRQDQNIYIYQWRSNVPKSVGGGGGHTDT